MLVDGSLRSLIQGVSQQPEEIRLAGQCTAQENYSSNPVDGLTRRAPTREIAELFSTASTVQWYEFNLNDVNYILAAYPGHVRIFTEDGTEKTVNELNSAFAYIDGGSLGFTTSSGITYVVNRSKTALMLASTPTYAVGYGVVYVKGGQYGRSYQIQIRWSGANINVVFTTPNGNVATDILQVATDYIATQLQAALNADVTFSANFTVGRKFDQLQIKANVAAAFKITTSDGEGGNQLFSITNMIQDAADLPQYAPQDLCVHIKGTGTSIADDWYVKFVVDSATPTATGAGFGQNGYWQEVVAPGINYKINSATMPHILTYDSGTGQFNFDLAGFSDRGAGDYVSNPDPSFIGATIEDIFVMQGRLGFLSGPNVIMSKTNKPFIFWRNSATTLLDSDPIDIYSTSKDVKKMLKAIPFNRDMIVYSDKGQFIIFGRNALTPTNCSLVLTTTFEVNLNATPVAAGRNIFQAQNYGRFSGIREFYADGSTDQNDARTITEQTLKYIKGSATALTTSTNFNILLVATDDNPKNLYVYEYIWVDQKKVQSSWSRWSFDMDVKFSYINQSVITLVQKTGTHYILGQIDLDIQDDSGLTYQVKLDRRKSTVVAGTTLANPYTRMPVDVTQIVFVQGPGCPTPGLLAYVSSYNAGTNTFTFSKNMGGGTVYYGIKYRSSYVPSNPRVRDGDGVAIGTGKLRVNNFIVHYTNTGFLGGRVYSPFYSDQNITFTGRYVGNPTTVVGEAAIVSGQFKIPFRADVNNANLEIYSESHLPATFTMIEWVGQYTKKGRRLAGTGGH